MKTVNLKDFEDSFVIYFGAEAKRINAYTFASTLSNFADAAKAANELINPGYEIEIVVEALGGGSFKATVRSIYRGASNLFSKDVLKGIVFSVISNYVYQHTIAPNSDVKVVVETNEVVIQQGNSTIIVPREVHEASKSLANVPKFVSGVQKAMQAVESDPTITSLGFTKNFSDKEPQVLIPRERFALLTNCSKVIDEPEFREIIEITEIQILRAILERSKSRRWQFVWGGVRISAPVIDTTFFHRFTEHEITIAPGDRLKVQLRIKQRKAADAGIYINEGYEVLNVLDHIPRVRQPHLKPPVPDPVS